MLNSKAPSLKVLRKDLIIVNFLGPGQLSALDHFQKSSFYLTDFRACEGSLIILILGEPVPEITSCSFISDILICLCVSRPLSYMTKILPLSPKVITGYDT